MRHLIVLVLPLDGILAHCRFTPSSVAGTHFIQLRAERQCGLNFLSKEVTRWQELGLEPPTFRPEVQRAHLTLE